MVVKQIWSVLPTCQTLLLNYQADAIDENELIRTFLSVIAAKNVHPCVTYGFAQNTAIRQKHCYTNINLNEHNQPSSSARIRPCCSASSSYCKDRTFNVATRRNASFAVETRRCQPAKTPNTDK